MRKLRTLLPLILAIAALALPASAHAAGQITLHLDTNHVSFGGSVLIDGQVPEGAGTTVDLFADTFPYGGDVPVATTTADDSGWFGVTVRPDARTNYHAMVRDDLFTDSVTTPVAVEFTGHGKCSKCNLHGKRLKRARTVFLISSLTWSPRLASQVAGLKVATYVRFGSQRKWPRMKVFKLPRRANGSWKWVTVVRIPKGTRHFEWMSCTDDLPQFNGYGLDSNDHRCGNKSVAWAH